MIIRWKSLTRSPNRIASKTCISVAAQGDVNTIKTKKNPAYICVFGIFVVPLQPKRLINGYDYFIRERERGYYERWAKDIEDELTALLEKYFALPYFEFKYEETNSIHWKDEERESK